MEAIHPLEDITADWARGNSTGKGIKVAVLDSGIDASHPAIRGPVNGYVAISKGPDGLVFDTSAHEDASGHGTACAGLIRGLAPNCELYSVKLLGAGLTGRGSVFASGVRWAIDHGMHICNISMGTTRREFFTVLHQVADQAYFRNIMLVAAANNLPIPSYPSVYASVISVAAHDSPDGQAFYYNPRPPVEFGAPGVNVRIAWQNGGWITATGNSFAAPYMTGLVAQILANHPELTVPQMKLVLRALAANIQHTQALPHRKGSKSD
jgi:subtilisin family serine protease